MVTLKNNQKNRAKYKKQLLKLAAISQRIKKIIFEENVSINTDLNNMYRNLGVFLFLFYEFEYFPCAEGTSSIPSLVWSSV